MPSHGLTRPDPGSALARLGPTNHTQLALALRTPLTPRRSSRRSFVRFLPLSLRGAALRRTPSARFTRASGQRTGHPAWTGPRRLTTPQSHSSHSDWPLPAHACSLAHKTPHHTVHLSAACATTSGLLTHLSRTGHPLWVGPRQIIAPRSHTSHSLQASPVLTRARSHQTLHSQPAQMGRPAPVRSRQHTTARRAQALGPSQTPPLLP